MNARLATMVAIALAITGATLTSAAAKPRGSEFVVFDPYTPYAYVVRCTARKPCAYHVAPRRFAYGWHEIQALRAFVRMH